MSGKRKANLEKMSECPALGKGGWLWKEEYWVVVGSWTCDLCAHYSSLLLPTSGGAPGKGGLAVEGGVLGSGGVLDL